MNPLFTEEGGKLSAEAPIQKNTGAVDLRLSPRKSISSGYESRCNSSSDSSSCTETDDKRFKRPINCTKREKRLAKQIKSEKKKKIDFDKNDILLISKSAQEFSFIPPQKRQPRRYQHALPTGLSNLSPIPEGKIDCSIPPPIWPRFESASFEKVENASSNDKVCSSRKYHNGTTNPVNFVFKYDEKYPKCQRELRRSTWNYINKETGISGELSVKSEYEQNWVECSKDHCKGQSCFRNGEKTRKSSDDSGSGQSSQSTLERLSVDKYQLTQEVLKDLTSLITYSMTKKNCLSIDCFLKNLADSIQKSLETICQTENEDNLKTLCDNLNRNKYLSKILTILLFHDEHHNVPPSITSDDNESKSVLEVELKKLPKNSINKNEEIILYNLNNLKEDIYSSGSESKNSSSSSSGCKDLYLSSNSSSAEKDNVLSVSGYDSDQDRNKSYINVEKSSEEKKEKEKQEKGENEEGGRSMIHHQRDFSSSSADSTFGFSDSSPPSSESSSGKGVLNPVFLHENIYSIPKSTRNAIICDSFNRIKDADNGPFGNCGSSAFEKLISAKRKTSYDSQTEELGHDSYEKDAKTRLPTVLASSKVDSSILKKIEHPYYVS